MPSKTVEILLGTPWEGPTHDLPRLSTFAMLPAEETAEVSARRSPWRIVQCPTCQALSYLSSVEELPGWTTCERCGQVFKVL